MFRIILIVLVFVFSQMAYANEVSAIESAMKAQWETPENRLSVAPVVMEANYAVAGWSQGTRGGRALLRRNHDNWEVFMCGGDDLTKQSVLEHSGLSPIEAKTLAYKLKQAEQGLSSETLKQLSIFEGVVPVGADSHHH